MQLPSLLDDAPLGTRIIVGTHLVFTLLCVISPGGIYALTLSASLVARGHLLPTVTYWLAAPVALNPVMALLMLLLCAWAALAYLPQQERAQGTLRFLVWFQLHATGAGLIYLLCALVLEPLMPVAYCIGLWPPLAVAMTLRSLEETHSSQVTLFGILPLPARWYPLALCVFLSLITLQLQLDLLAAWILGIGVHQAKGGAAVHPAVAFIHLPLHRLLPSVTATAALEDSASGRELGGMGASGTGGSWARRHLCSFLARAASWSSRRCPARLRSHYVRAGSAVGGSVKTPADAGAAQPNKTHSFEPFSGSGNRLGSAEP